VSELDRLKEQIAYLKFWQGIMVVTEISLVGWLISTAGTSDPALWALPRRRRRRAWLRHLRFTSPN